MSHGSASAIENMHERIERTEKNVFLGLSTKRVFLRTTDQSFAYYVRFQIFLNAAYQKGRFHPQLKYEPQIVIRADFRRRYSYSYIKIIYVVIKYVKLNILI